MNYTDSLFIFAFAAIVVVALALRPWPVFRQWFLTIISLLVLIMLVVQVKMGAYSLALFLAVAIANFCSQNR